MLLFVTEDEAEVEAGINLELWLPEEHSEVRVERSTTTLVGIKKERRIAEAHEGCAEYGARGGYGECLSRVAVEAVRNETEELCYWPLIARWLEEAEVAAEELEPCLTAERAKATMRAVKKGLVCRAICSQLQCKNNENANNV